MCNSLPGIERDDEQLVRGAREGRRDDLEELLRRHYQRLYALCRRLTGNDADAADATQEALITITRKLDRFDGRSRFSTWAYRVAVRAALDELRRRSRRPVPRIEGLEPPGGDRPAPGEAVEQRVDVDAALAQLPLEFRAPVILRDLCDLDYAEIALVLNIPAGTVRSRIARGRAALVPLLGPQPAPNQAPPNQSPPNQSRSTS